MFGMYPFISDLRQAIDRCLKLDVGCDPQIAPKLRSVLTKEWSKRMGLGGEAGKDGAPENLGSESKRDF
jgi:hypothetical protein